MHARATPRLHFLDNIDPSTFQSLFAAIDPGDLTNDYRGVYQNRERYVQIIDDAVAVLQHRDMAAIYRITGGRWLPGSSTTAGRRRAG